ncbi:hypothetical protein [Ruegeria arenilitoris]|uniref:hypothetical protein n=1 Tax=Ruegeria arenilitoris TaxID=1173585 RepID=UPI00147E40F8|nr:hypothetical protein [Ruegeria arenilitoris]
MGRRIYRDIEIDGVIYPNVNAVAKAKGVKPDTVRVALRKGTAHRIGVGTGGVEPMSVRIHGRVFADAKAAAKHCGITVGGIYEAIRCGREDRVGLPLFQTSANAKPFTIGTLTFPSMRAASLALGFERGEYISKVLKQKSVRGQQRILKAAMEYAERKSP